ncbi:MAG: metal-dependent hydrolase [Rubrobacteraceae bacterium]
METYSHSFLTWALAKHGLKAGRAAGIAGAVGAALPDLPSFAGTAYYVGTAYLTEGWSSVHSKEMLEKIYFSGPFGGPGSALHSAVPAMVLLGTYGLLRFGWFDRRGMLKWFLIGWLGHTFADFLTHVNDARPLFWPISGWEWSSPVSYYNSAYYGQEFFVVSHGFMFLIFAALLAKRLRGRKDPAPEPWK